MKIQAGRNISTYLSGEDQSTANASPRLPTSRISNPIDGFHFTSREVTMYSSISYVKEQQCNAFILPATYAPSTTPTQRKTK